MNSPLEIELPVQPLIVFGVLGFGIVIVLQLVILHRVRKGSWGGKFVECSQCGHRLSPAALACTRCGHPCLPSDAALRSQLEACHVCRRIVAKAASNCPSCGAVHQL